MVPVLILAAGQGRRMGRVKALAPWVGGNLLDDALSRARAVTDRVAVVVGAGDPLVRCRVRDRPRYWCCAESWRHGQSESLKSGLRFLRNRELCNGVLVMLVDQPLIPVKHLQALAAKAGECPRDIIATRALERAMAPAYLPKHLWPRLTSLSGDRGAGAVINSVPSIQITCREAALDVDTPSQLEATRACLR